MCSWVSLNRGLGESEGRSWGVSLDGMGADRARAFAYRFVRTCWLRVGDFVDRGL